MKLAANPIYARLTRSARPPSLRVTVWLALALSAVGVAWIALATSAALAQGVNQALTFMSPLGTTYLVILVMLPVAAITAVLVTARDATGEDFVLLRATPVTGRTVATGYFAAVLFRLRIPLVLFVALMPALAAIGFAQIYMRSRLPGVTYIPSLVPGLEIADPVIRSVVDGVLPGLTYCITLAGGVALSISYGVWMALQWRRSVPALVSLLALPALFAADIVAASFVMSPPLSLPVLLVDLIIMVSPWALMLLTLRLASRRYDRMMLA